MWLVTAVIIILNLYLLYSTAAGLL
jgi:hypothetical protein